MSSPKKPTHDVFNRAAKPFRMMGKQFKYEFMPSCHFQEVLLELLTIIVGLEQGVTEAIKQAAADDDVLQAAIEAQGKIDKKQQTYSEQLMEVAMSFLKTRLYEIAADVLQYQNDHEYISREELSKRTRPLEMAEFSDLIMDDEEITTAIMRYVASLGKLQNLIPTVKEKPSRTRKSTQS